MPMKIDEEKELLNNICYVDANLKITEDANNAVGFLDVILDNEQQIHFIINFFECIGTAKYAKEAIDLITQWLIDKYGDHILSKYTFEPLIPLHTSVALCNENSAIHNRSIGNCWMQFPFQGAIHFTKYGVGNRFGQIWLWDDAVPIEGIIKFQEKENGTLVTNATTQLEVGTDIKVFPALIVDRHFVQEFNPLLECIWGKCSSTKNIKAYNAQKRSDYERKCRSTPALTITKSWNW